MYGNMTRTHHQLIAKPHYGLHQKIISQWLLSMVTVRNSCAHFARLYCRTPIFSLRYVMTTAQTFRRLSHGSPS